MIALKTGLHRALPSTAYHRRELGVVSRTALQYLDRSPAHYKAWVDGTLADEPTPALVFGAAFHCALLEPEVFARTYAVEPDFGDCRFKENRAVRDSWREDHAGRILLSAEDMASIFAMSAKIKAHPLASRILADGEPELTAKWVDGETGLHCKVRGDYYVPGRALVADVKTAQDASPEAFRRDVAKFRYHVQAALYRDGFAAAGARADHFVFVVVEKKPPHEVATYFLDASAEASGRAHVRRLMGRMAECMRANEWPGYPVDLTPIDLPPWAA